MNQIDSALADVRGSVTDSFKDIEKLEADLWEARTAFAPTPNSPSSDYFMPVLGVIFLRHAANRFDVAHRQIEADQTSGKMPKRKVLHGPRSRAAR